MVETMTENLTPKRAKRPPEAEVLRTIQFAVGLFAIVFEVVGAVYFGVWIRKTDWLMGHTHGPPAQIMTAFWAAGAGVVGTGLWMTIAVYGRFAFSVRSEQRRSKWRWLQPILLVLLLIPAGFVVLIGAAELPRARVQMRVQRANSGSATVLELIEALNSPDIHVRASAIQALTKRGPEASPAVPKLAQFLNDRALCWDAAKALAAIGPDAKPAIPALVDAIKREQGVRSGVGHDGPSTSSWLAAKALTSIGPASLPALITLLSHEDRYVRMSAINAIGNMGPQSKSAVAALGEVANEEDESVRQAARVALERIANRREVAR